VKTSVVLDADTHGRLVVAATLRSVDRSTYAAEVLGEALKGVVDFDKALPSGPGEANDRPGGGAAVNLDAEEEAA
jgi:hypothetical protein